MRRLRQRRLIGLGGADIHAAKHQCRINADQLQRQLLYQLHRRTSLAAGSGAHQEYRGGQGGVHGGSMAESSGGL